MHPIELINLLTIITGAIVASYVLNKSNVKELLRVLWGK